jgi:hypothetical protein
MSTTRAELRTPRSAAIAGILFAVLLTTSFVLLRLALPVRTGNAAAWLTIPGRRAAVVVALNLIPFAGIAFLWFIGVVRDRIGRHEDRFFATVFLGSGLLFVAMLFVASAIAGGLLADSAIRQEGSTSEAWRLGARFAGLLVNIYAMRMAAVFTISTATIALRTGAMPRWIAYLGYATALVLLVGVGISPLAELLFPFWILILSIETLVTSRRRGGGDAAMPDLSSPGAA